MTFLFNRGGRGIAALLLLASPLAAQRWRTQYFYDQDKTALHFVDMQFPSATRGVAVGVIEEQGKRKKSVAIVTSDGGAHWQTVDLPDVPVSLVLSERRPGLAGHRQGRAVADHRGRQELEEAPQAPRGDAAGSLHFRKRRMGGRHEEAGFETHDGGKRWTPLGAADEPPGNPHYSTYTFIAFASQQFGIITGYNLPPRHTTQRLPDC